MPMKLNYQTLASLPANLTKPLYHREQLSGGIVHIGVGNFHRAHQAIYLHRLFNLGKSHDWAIIGAGTKSFDTIMREKLKQQDYLTTVVDLDAKGLSAQICGSMIDFIENDTAKLISKLSEDSTRIVSLTITEGGYYINSKGGFDLTHPDILHDISNHSQPKTVFGMMLAALQHRREHGIAAFTVMSCDNIPHNGDVTKRIMLEMAKRIDTHFAHWLEAQVTFPNSMVDCITPATSEAEKTRLINLFGVEDLAPVFCEPFRQWVLEDNFCNGRPALEEVGVEFVADVAPFELMKLRILNGGHAAIAYPAALLGVNIVSDVMTESHITAYLKKLTTEEIIPSLAAVPGVNFAEYAELIVSRFANPEVRDTVPRLCQDASNRLPKFIFPIIRDNLAAGRSVKGLALVVALWCRLCAMNSSAEQGLGFDLYDEHAPRLAELSLQAKDNPVVFLQMHDIFGEIGTNAVFVDHFSAWLSKLWHDGVAKTLADYYQA
ncbi:mannitol dehydrogenase family protein [Rheinheimera sp. UJ51]|uniref:mannitol dehydrogenase family protein n=1 Tax=Rheinheimera sp. UJ51 TaxID=2892446 RepID=UPI001E59F86E|nr:mannitol dehydrogenase family protein [Rheinheimera sp. UJ51]MCC5451325.1 mannitol dehydrogenase family protein [Rheinheimera sp. UJ51]